MSAFVVHEREQDDADVERYSKRSKLDGSDQDSIMDVDDKAAIIEPDTDHILPPSHALLGIPLPVVKEGGAMNFLESNVGISEYVGHGTSKVEGIIKQRYPITSTKRPTLLNHCMQVH
jgi:tRNA pseudouridine13 synthase